MRAVILSGGDIYDCSAVRLKDNDFVICADAGARHLEKLRIKPDVFMGDFDSFKGSFGEVPGIKFPTEKDETDTRLAVDYAISEGYDEILIIGALGGRADHSIANIFLLKYILDKNIKAELSDGKNRVFLAGEEFTLNEKGVYVSLFPLFSDIEGLTLRGMKYPLENYRLPQGSQLCISNEVEDDTASVSFKSGILLVMLCRD